MFYELNFTNFMSCLLLKYFSLNTTFLPRNHICVDGCVVFNLWKLLSLKRENNSHRKNIFSSRVILIIVLRKS